MKEGRRSNDCRLFLPVSRPEDDWMGGENLIE
nr:MAG TPA: hypothetical protein [Caudoviricetes sp.]